MLAFFLQNSSRGDGKVPVAAEAGSAGREEQLSARAATRQPAGFALACPGLRSTAAGPFAAAPLRSLLFSPVTPMGRGTVGAAPAACSGWAPTAPLAPPLWVLIPHHQCSADLGGNVFLSPFPSSEQRRAWAGRSEPHRGG